MKALRLAFRLVLCVPAFLAGCGFFDFEEREPWRAREEAACYARGLVKLSPYIQKAKAIEGKGICGLDRPLRVTALADGSISLGSASLVMSCPVTAALENWVANVVIPAAYARYGSPVVEIKNAGTYNCRSRNNVPGARLSEHAFANAFDFTGAVLANGYTVSVRKGWSGSVADRAFLREITAGACGPFTTVLGPGSDGKHEDHLHLDLAHHNAAGTYRYCKPHPAVPAPTMPAFGNDMPMASAGSSVWQGGANGSYGQSLPEASQAPAYGQRLPPAPVYGQRLPPAPVPTAATSLPPAMIESIPAPQPPGCPPGYICTPLAGSGNALPPPVGWSVGAQPVRGYSSTEITGSIGGYSDD